MTGPIRRARLTDRALLALAAYAVLHVGWNVAFSLLVQAAA